MNTINNIGWACKQRKCGKEDSLYKKHSIHKQETKVNCSIKVESKPQAF